MILASSIALAVFIYCIAQLAIKANKYDPKA